jgi:hypothetical protein
MRVVVKGAAAFDLAHPVQPENAVAVVQALSGD